MNMGRRFWLFLYGSPNMLGSALALGGLSLLFTGTIKDYWTFIVPGLYGIGFLSAPRPQRTAVELGKAWDDAALRSRLSALVGRARRLLPPETAETAARIEEGVLAILAHTTDGDGNAYQLHIARQTVNSYLPEIIDGYARLPSLFAKLHPLRDGKTAQHLVSEQLGLIEQELRIILEDLSRNDAQALVVHGEFLKKKLAGGAGEIFGDLG